MSQVESSDEEDDCEYTGVSTATPGHKRVLERQDECDAQVKSQPVISIKISNSNLLLQLALQLTPFGATCKSYNQITVIQKNENKEK